MREGCEAEEGGEGCVASSQWEGGGGEEDGEVYNKRVYEKHLHRVQYSIVPSHVSRDGRPLSDKHIEDVKGRAGSPGNRPKI